MAFSTLSAGPSNSINLSSEAEIQCLYKDLELAKQEIKCYEDLLQDNSTIKKKLKHLTPTTKEEKQNLKRV